MSRRPKGWPAPPADGEQLPPHTPTCMVCGPEATCGYGLRAVRSADGVETTFTFDERHAGGPGLAHGGAVAAVCDDVLGHVLSVIEAPGVTRRLEVDYLKPVVLGQPHRITAQLVERDGRKLWVECEATTAEGVTSFRARGLFVIVGLEHFLAGLAPAEQERARAYLAGLGEGGDVTAP